MREEFVRTGNGDVKLVLPQVLFCSLSVRILHHVLHECSILMPALDEYLGVIPLEDFYGPKRRASPWPLLGVAFLGDSAEIQITATMARMVGKELLTAS